MCGYNNRHVFEVDIVKGKSVAALKPSRKRRNLTLVTSPPTSLAYKL
jgi:hypothetical protein